MTGLFLRKRFCGYRIASLRQKKMLMVFLKFWIFTPSTILEEARNMQASAETCGLPLVMRTVEKTGRGTGVSHVYTKTEEGIIRK